jgi:hypothetical protein
VKTFRLLCLLTVGGLPLLIQGCAFTAGAAAGAAGAEALEEEGYELESPVQKEDDDEGNTRP